MLPSVVGLSPHDRVGTVRRADLKSGVGPHDLLRHRRPARPGRDDDGPARNGPPELDNQVGVMLGSPDQLKLVPSTQIRCSTMASFLASATFARLPPIRLASRVAQALRGEPR